MLLAALCSLASTAPAEPVATEPIATVGGSSLATNTLVAQVPLGVPRPEFPARSWLLADANSGEILAAQAAHQRDYPASTLKTLNLLAALPRIDPEARITIIPADMAEGSQVGLVPKQEYRVQELLEGAMLASGNDAATALARASGGPAGVAGHIRSMQELARELGALDTTVRNPTGLDAPGQLSSAYDLALFGRAALANPTLAKLAATKSVQFPGKQDAKGNITRYQVGNLNRLLYNYEGAIGVKTGFTTLARSTTIAAVRRGDHTYLLTALHRDNGSWGPEAKVFDWAFSHGARAQPVGRLVNPGELQKTASPQPALSPSPASVTTNQKDRPSQRSWWPGLCLAAALLAIAVIAVRRSAQVRIGGGPRRAR